jgi:rhodanese-related sulfurtransferase
MLKKSLITLAQSIVITAVAVTVALMTNAVRSKGIPLIADVPYDIFSTCKDSKSTVPQHVSTVSAWSQNALAVDAGPKPQFDAEHVKDAINVPYSALFGASAEDIEAVRRAVTLKNASNVIVYGTFLDPENPLQKVDFAKPLADQLTESGLENVFHIEGGLDAMKKQGAPTVKGRENRQ